MKAAIVGAGFTGLAAGLELSRRGARVDVFEAADKVGGLAVGFKRPGWKWTAEKFYHHIFTNDDAIIGLSKELGLAPEWHRPITAVRRGEAIFPFDSAKDLFLFPGLGMLDKLRMGAVLLGLKLLSNGKFLEKYSARDWLIKTIGRRGFETVWEPLLTGKFADSAAQVNMAWFWARIKKRTANLGTFPGGFQALAEKMADEIKKKGGRIFLGKSVGPADLIGNYDAALSTLPERNGKVNYLDAHVLLLELTKQFLPGIYWLNILDRKFPFLVVGEHTNFVPPENFGGSHLVYVGNYLPQGHKLFSLSSNEVLNKFYPWLKKINPGFSRRDIINAWVFRGPFAQPVMTVNYSKLIPPIKREGNLYAANQAMIYPWDRGTNYAVELGKKAAREILRDIKSAKCKNQSAKSS